MSEKKRTIGCNVTHHRYRKVRPYPTKAYCQSTIVFGHCVNTIEFRCGLSLGHGGSHCENDMPLVSDFNEILPRYSVSWYDMPLTHADGDGLLTIAKVKGE